MDKLERRTNKKASYKGWAIRHFSAGLYEDVKPTRSEIIALHCHYLAIEGEDLPEYYFGKLTAAQKKAWARHRRFGDRAVKVEVREL